MMKRHRLGEAGEALAAERLAGLGYEVIGRRFACRRGDVDLVCLLRGEIVFVEVKTRSSSAFGSASEAITPAKRRALAACAGEYRRMTGWRGTIRYHLAAVRLGYGDSPGHLEVLADAIA